MKPSLRHSPLFKKPQTKKHKPRKWSFFRIAGKALRRTCMTLGALLLISLIGSWTYMLFFQKSRIQPLPDKMVLLLSVDGPFIERRNETYLSGSLFDHQVTIHQVTEALEKGSNDDRVKGVLIAIKDGGAGIAQVQEIRQAIETFRDSGKFVTAYSTSFGGTGNSIGSYYLASKASEIWMQPIGSLAITGFNAELPFSREALDYIGIKPEFFKRKEYKSAMAPLTDKDIDESTREMMRSIIQNLGKQFTEDVAKDRGLSAQSVKNLVDAGFYTDKQALNAGLIDHLGYGDMVISDINKKVVGDPEARDVNFVNVDYYLARRKNEIDKTILKQGLDENEKLNTALIYVNGAIMPRDDNDAMIAAGNYSAIASAEKISNAIFDASKRDDVQAIVLRINSPGGSPTASETIRHAVEKAKKRGKKVVVSMSSTAASGGYWIAPDADKIVALPATLTGSIGVVGGKFVLRDLWKNLKVKWARISYGENAAMWSSNSSFDKEEKRLYEENIDAIYSAFLERVANGRGLSLADVEKVAKGRAWTGQQALERKLVDELGGLSKALDVTAQLLGKNSRQDLNIFVLPRQKSLQEKIINILRQQIHMAFFTNKASHILQTRTAQDVFSGLDMVYHPENYMTHSRMSFN